jgi:hypothetical protein
MVVVCLGFVAIPSYAQSIHECVVEGKPVSFQSQPCGPGETTRSVREYVPEPQAPVRVAAASGTRVVRARAERAVRRDAGAVRDACADTKAQRDAWERRVGLKRTYDQLRHWNDAVARACN